MTDQKREHLIIKRAELERERERLISECAELVHQTEEVDQKIIAEVGKIYREFDTNRRVEFIDQLVAITQTLRDADASHDDKTGECGG